MAKELATKKKTRREGTVAVTVDRKNGTPEFVNEKDEVEKFPVDALQDLRHVGYVRVEGSVTKNMGDFNSVRVGVAIEMPCKPTDKAAERLYAKLSDKVDDMIQQEIDRATS